jgi:hypothetical protein
MAMKYVNIMFFKNLDQSAQNRKAEYLEPFYPGQIEDLISCFLNEVPVNAVPAHISKNYVKTFPV